MTWLHQCRLPSRVSIALRRARPGATWACKCGTTYLLEKREVPHTGIAYWRWQHPDETADSEAQEEHPLRPDLHATAELAYAEPTQLGGEYYERPTIIGFAANG